MQHLIVQYAIFKINKTVHRRTKGGNGTNPGRIYGIVKAVKSMAKKVFYEVTEVFQNHKPKQNRDKGRCLLNTGCG